jgi:hypothetical protein
MKQRIIISSSLECQSHLMYKIHFSTPSVSSMHMCSVSYTLPTSSFSSVSGPNAFPVSSMYRRVWNIWVSVLGKFRINPTYRLLLPIWSTCVLNKLISVFIAMETSGKTWLGLFNWGTMLQAGRSRVQFPMRSLDFFNWPNPSSCTMALESTQPLPEMSNRN